MKKISSFMIFLISLFGLNACVASNASFDNGSSYNTYKAKPSTERWFLTEINNAQYQGRRITLNIASDNKVGGFSGCNQYFVSNVDIKGNQLSFGPIGATKRLCADYNSNNLEKRYLSVLKDVTYFQRSNSRLVLEGRSGNLVFYKKSKR